MELEVLALLTGDTADCPGVLLLLLLLLLLVLVLLLRIRSFSAAVRLLLMLLRMFTMLFAHKTITAQVTHSTTNDCVCDPQLYCKLRNDGI